jgi:hypothetical protein
MTSTSGPACTALERASPHQAIFDNFSAGTREILSRFTFYTL